MRALLQRKCGCGGACGPCKDKRELRRSAIDPRRPDAVPRSVDRVLAGSGAPLDRETRRTLEPHFGHDFSTVRVHTGSDAANAARDVNARAWTVGNHIAFGAGHGPDDMRLLAHELTHVVQQSAMPQTSSLTIGAANDPSESEADAVASAVLSGAAGSQPAVGSRRAESPPLHLRRQSDPFFHDPWPEKTESAEIIYQSNRRPAGRALSPGEITTVAAATGATAPAASAVHASMVPTFILHDTGGDYSLAEVKAEAKKTGPQGIGVQAMAPHPEGFGKKRVEPDLVNARPMYERRRPSATTWEQSNDILDKGPRETLLRTVWKSVKKDEREGVLDYVILDVDADEKTKKGIRRGAINWLTTKLTKEEAKALTDGSRTTATWAIESLCFRVDAGIADQMVAPGVDPQTLTDSCQQLGEWFATRSDRLESVVGVEIVQVKEGLPNPPYSTKQYEQVADLYLRAALAALRWPYVTTHWLIDKGIPSSDSHIDPRCYNVDKLYMLIAGKAGHGIDTIYGIEPSYGTKPENNVWWSKFTCHGGPPS